MKPYFFGGGETNFFIDYFDLFDRLVVSWRSAGWWDELLRVGVMLVCSPAGTT